MLACWRLPMSLRNPLSMLTLDTPIEATHCVCIWVWKSSSVWSCACTALLCSFFALIHWVLFLKCLHYMNLKENVKKKTKNKTNKKKANKSSSLKSRFLRTSPLDKFVCSDVTRSWLSFLNTNSAVIQKSLIFYFEWQLLSLKKYLKKNLNTNFSQWVLVFCNWSI